ncbi:EAL domain-containing protein [Sphingopyxis alaskensis]|jgi:diguanylate cyclase (GGDEF)-like protein/PAS domain S-box-containing protein|uniref:Diguanylate cyclase/phosphodiesterase with PAS/PAC sensor(S) n=2 Tax=Sphingopyxis alaskensis TaxID=117207 RepID=Q1GR24_SPHAL|nr:EAL domain-containing protein [Sphingopyxis alaskensis]ABF53898.1 diguanylate cyclase/phosphodiesterase with PAS/PAC sensor(s) [Sphingopyxis alaskensis RB2256]
MDMPSRTAPGEQGGHGVDEGPRGFFGRIGSRATRRRGDAAANLQTREALLLLQNYEESGRGWFWSTDADGRLTYITDVVARTMGRSAAALLGTPLTDLFLPADSHGERQRTLRFLLTRQSAFDDLPLRGAFEGGDRWWAISGRPQYDADGQFTGYRGSGTDITAQRRSAEDASRLALYDSLTGLANRFNISKKLDATLAAFAQQQRSCAIMLLDLDRFKQVNDTLGHPAGDALLKQVAERLLKFVGDKEMVSRLGGDEFQIILPDIDDRGKLGDMAADIIASLSQPYSVEGSRCIIGASVGVAIAPFDGQSSDDLVRNADLALYAAKGNGCGRFAFYSSDLHQAAEDRRALEEDLRDALARGEIALAYQPVVNARSNMVTGVEALIRWTHRDRGAISPALFIPIAEEANLIWPLGEWVLRKACEDAAGWPGEMRVAVNVSPIQFANPELPKVVAKALAASGLSPDRLELEITESVFLGDTAEANRMFKALKGLGVRLALDDFGTGYSSLAYLQSAPFDKIKIDQSFVRGATEPGSRNSAIIAAIVALAEALDMETTAEGIESLDQLDLVRKLNVSHVQGYVYSRPVPCADLVGHTEAGVWTIKPSGPARQRNDRLSLFRKVGAIHDNHRYAVVIRNLSATGAFIEGILDVPVGTRFVIDFGEGQLVTATVRRSMKHQQGIEFEQTMVSDGNGGLCTRHRVSPYLIAAAAQQTSALALPAFTTTSDWKAA